MTGWAASNLSMKLATLRAKGVGLWTRRVTEQEQSGRWFDMPTQRARLGSLKWFASTFQSSWWVLVLGALVGAKGRIVFWSICLVFIKLFVVLGLRLSLMFPKFWKVCVGFGHLISSKLDHDSILLVWKQQKGSPVQTKTFGIREWSVRLIFSLLTLTRTFFLQQTVDSKLNQGGMTFA